MERIEPNRAECALIREHATAQVRRYGGKGRVRLEPGERVPFAGTAFEGSDPHINIRMVDSSPDWSDSELFGHVDFETFKRGFPAAPGGLAEVDFYCYDSDGLVCNVTARFEGGRLARLNCTNEGPDDGLLLWQAEPSPAQAEPAPVAEPRVVRTIDMTPTWGEILPTLLFGHENANATGRAAALAELQRMAKLADIASVALGAHRRPDAPAEPEGEAIRAALTDAAALLTVYASPSGRDGPNASTRGQALATVRQIQTVLKGA